MEEIDDFGELYTDVGIQDDAGISSLSNSHQLRVGEEEEKSKGNVDGGFYPNCYNKDTIFSEDESLSSEHIGRSDGDAEDDEKVVVSETAIPVAEEEDCAVDNCSDSEDDLHIVLNEDDGALGCFSRGTSFRNRRGVDRGEEEEDGLMIVAGKEFSSKDRKRLDPSPLTDATECSLGHSGERAGSVKSSCIPQHFQFKYVRRSHASSFPSKTRSGNGIGLHLTSNTCASTSSCDQNGAEFSLPRYKTIFDIGIENFEWKPWRRPGVDITDFFNFGFDEGSWKAYCRSLENLRRQASMLSRNPVYESSRPKNQVNEDETLPQSLSLKGMTSDISQTDTKDKSSSEKVEMDSIHLEVPIGKAIQVEGSIRERRPSMGVRRPRHRDSDVVIEIPMKDCTEDSTVSSQDEVEHTGDSSTRVSKNGSSAVDNDQSMKQIGSASEDSRKSRHPEDESTCPPMCMEVDGPQCQQGEGNTLGLTAKVANAEQESEDEDIPRSNPTPELPSQNQFEHNESLSYLDSGQLYGSASDTGNTDPEDISDCSSQEEDQTSDKKLHDSMEVKRTVDNYRGSSRKEKKYSYDGDWRPILRQKNMPHNKKQQVCKYDEEDLFDSKERGRMMAYSSRGFDKKQFSGSKHFLRNQDDREYYLERRSGHKDDRSNLREGFFNDRRHGDCETHRESISSVSKDLYFSEQERYMWHKRKSEYAQKERYGEAAEFYQERYERHATYCGREASVRETYERHVPNCQHEARDLDHRKRYDRHPYPGLGKDWSRPDHYRSPFPRHYGEFQVSDGRQWCELTPPRYGEHDSWISDERHMRDWGCPDYPSMPSRRVGDEYCYDYHEGRHYPSSMLERDLDFDNGYDDVGYLDKRRFGWQSKSTKCVNDGSNFKHHDQDGSFFHETRPRHSYHSDNQWSALDRQIENGRISTMRENTEALCFKHLPTFRSGDNKHLYDWEGKHQSQRSFEAEDIRFHRYRKPDYPVEENWGSVRHLDEVNNPKDYLLDIPKVESRHIHSTCSESRSWCPGNLERSSDKSRKINRDKHSSVQQEQVSVFEKGQPAESRHDEPAPSKKNKVMEKTIRSAVVVATQVSGIAEKEKQQSENGVDDINNRANNEFDDRIRETLAKMERRRERFKEPISVKKEPDVCPMPQAAPVDEAGEVKQQRPVRKRRWISG